MGGRNAKPVDLQVAEGNPNHLTKAEIERRKKAEIKLGEFDLSKVSPPEYVKEDLEAYKKWKELIKQYKKAAALGAELISSTDLGALAKYCQSHSEYIRLIRKRQLVEQIDYVQLNSLINKTLRGQKRKNMNLILSLDADGKIERQINAKIKIMSSYEDRLFLTPLSKLKNIPAKPKPTKENRMEEEFDV